MHSNYQKLALATSLVVAAVMAGCKKEPAGGPGAGGPPGGGMPPPLVSVVDAIAQDVPEYIDCIGKTTALESVTITPRIAGQIVERRFEDGAEVKKGQVLFVIDPTPSQAALQSAQAALASAKASSALADIELQRYQAVAGTNAISKSDFDVKKNAVDVAQAQVASAEAAVRTAQINLDFCTVTSPIDGRAGARQVDVGNVVKENEAQLLSVQKIDPIYADFTVNEQQLVSVRANMANGTLKTIVRLPTDGATDGRQGELTFLDNAVQDATGTIRLRATMPNKDAHFWPGQFVGVRLILKTLQGAVLVPTSAQQLSQKGPFVFVVKPDSTAEIRPITAGQAQGDNIVITSGLQPGERVITDGQMMVRPGMPVRLPGQGGPPGAPGGGGGGGGGVPAGNMAGGAPGSGVASSSSSDHPAAPGSAGSGERPGSATQGGGSDTTNAPSGEGSRNAGAPAGASQGGVGVQPGRGGNEGGR